MRSSERFAVSIHILTYIEIFGKSSRVTSDILSQSINTNPVIVRNILGLLKKAELIKVARGAGGGISIRDDITYLDVYRAVEENQNPVNYHTDTNKMCPVGRNINNVLSVRMEKAQESFCKELERYTIRDTAEEIVRMK